MKYILSVFFVANLLNYLDRYIMAALLPVLAQEFNLSHFQEGLLFSAFVPSYVLFSPLFGLLGEYYSRTKLAACGIFIWSLACVASSFATEFNHLLIARIFIGAGEASFGALIPAFLKDYFSDDLKFNKALSVFYIAMPVGSALGYIMGGLAARPEVANWQSIFIHAGWPGLILAALFFLILDPRKIENKPAKSQKFSTLFSSYKKASFFFLIILGYVFSTASLNIVASFILRYSNNAWPTENNAATYIGIIMCLTGLLGTWLGSVLSNKFLHRRNTVEGAFVSFCSLVTFAAIPFMLFVVFTNNYAIFLTSLFFAELFIFMTFAPINSALVISSPSGLLSLSQGIVILIINLFGTWPAPAIAGKIADRFGLVGSFSFAIVCLFVSAIIWSITAKNGALQGKK